MSKGLSINMAEEGEVQKKSGPDWRLIFCLYVICFSPILFGPIIHHWHEELSSFPLYIWAYDKGLEFVAWADFFFATDDPRRAEIEEHVFYIKKFARLTLFFSVFILFFFKFVLRSNRLDLDLSGHFKQWQNLSKEEKEKKYTVATEGFFLFALITTFLLLTDFGLFTSVSGKTFPEPGYFSTVVLSIIPLLCWQAFSSLAKSH